jgi:hypothetical protein
MKADDQKREAMTEIGNLVLKISKVERKGSFSCSQAITQSSMCSETGSAMLYNYSLNRSGCNNNRRHTLDYKNRYWWTEVTEMNSKDYDRLFQAHNLLQCATGSGVIGFLGRMYSIMCLSDRKRRERN